MAGRGRWRPKREASTDGSTDDPPRRDVADYREPPQRTGRQQRELGSWARDVADSLKEPTPAERRAEQQRAAARARELDEDYRERAAIFEYLCGFPRDRAEQMARDLVYQGAR